jgi:sigma-E factor negative regulatory protein RseB
VLLLILAPALVIVTGAEALPLGQGSTPSRAQTGAPAAPAAPGGTAPWPDHAGDSISALRAPAQTRPADDGGLHLLQQAAAAGRDVSYEGVQIISWWSPDGTATVAVDVTHGPRQGTLLKTLGGPAPEGESLMMAHEPGAQPGDVLGVTEQTLDLLSANYQVVAAGPGSACDRPATVVEALRGDGTVAGKFWLDNVTKITLRRELFDDQSRMINESTFIDLNLDSPAAAGALQAQRAAAARPWNALTPVELVRMRAKGWPVPAQLPGGLVLFDARQTMMHTGRVFQLGYSDGLSGVSLFLQRGGLPHRLAGWRQVEIGGRTVYARDPIPQGLTWSSHGYVLTLIAYAPATTIGAVVQALPHDGQLRFWSRLRHGFARVISWIDPFG